MLCDIEVQDAPTIVTDDEKAIERAEGDRRNSEEVHRGNRFPVITEKGKPALGRLRISRCPFHPTRDRSLGDKVVYWPLSGSGYKIERLSGLRPYCDATRSDWITIWNEWKDQKRRHIFLCENHAFFVGFLW